MEKLINTKTVFHIHTNYSNDSYSKPSKIIDIMVNANIDNVIITDHNSIRGAVEAQNYASRKYNNKINVIIGEEVKTNIGDIIGFPLHTEIQEVDHFKVVEEIKRQGGFVCLPHPYKYHNLYKIHDINFLKNVDFIEVFNSRLNKKLNNFAEELADGLTDKKKIVGSDAHLKRELLNVYFMYNENMEITQKTTNFTSKRNYWLSQCIKGIKKKDIKLIFQAIVLAAINKF